MISYIAPPDVTGFARDFCVYALSAPFSFPPHDCTQASIFRFELKCYSTAVLALLVWDFSEHPHSHQPACWMKPHCHHHRGTQVSSPGMKSSISGCANGPYSHCSGSRCASCVTVCLLLALTLGFGAVKISHHTVACFRCCRFLL